MATLSPIPSYVLGTACIGRGAMAILSPKKEYGHVGLPLESAALTPAKSDSSSGGISPLMYFKGIREATFGMTLVALQLQGKPSEDALTAFAAIVSLARFGDGLVVWLYGGKNLRYRAWGHWITGAGFVGWVLWRLRWKH